MSKLRLRVILSKQAPDLYHGYSTEEEHVFLGGVSLACQGAVLGECWVCQGVVRGLDVGIWTGTSL